MVLLLFGTFLLVVMDYSSVWVCPEKIIQHLQILNFSSFPLEIEEYNLPFEPYPSSSNVFPILLLHIQKYEMNKERALLLVLIKASICTHHKQLERQKTKGQKIMLIKRNAVGKKNLITWK
jgi:hypothetical protein